MKKWLSYIFMTAVFCMTAVSCSEEIFEEPLPAQSSTLRLTVYVPGGETRVAGSYDGTSSGLDDSTNRQRFIDEGDIYVLQFNSMGKLVHVVDPLTVSGSNGNPTRTLSGKLKRVEGNRNYLVVLGNLRQQNINIQGLGTSFSGTELLARYEGWEDSDIYKDLIFSYPSAPWNINDRKLPLWGKTDISLNQNQNIVVRANCGLYRGVAKIGVQVDASCTDDFKLTSVYIYYINEKGYFAAPTKVPDPDRSVQYTEPDIPDCAQRGEDDPLIYRLESYTEDGNNVVRDKKFLNQIYVTEADNKPGGRGARAMKIVVGGLYTGDNPNNTTDTTYYRIDLMDDKDNPGGEKQPFDIIRNHSYVFNINSVAQPGAPTPEDALPHLTVSIEDYTEQFMRGVPDQYTLTVDKSVIKFENFKDLHPKNLTIWTDLGEGWKIDTTSASTDFKGDWFEISQYEGEDNRDAVIQITPKSENQDITRRCSFYVTAGNIRKEIKIIMPQPETANSYIVGEGDHDLIVTIKGNGLDGVNPEGTYIIPLNNPDSASVVNFIKMRPAKIGVIWETAKGLVKLINPADSSEVSNSDTEGHMTYVDLPAEKNSITYRVNIRDAEDGGGASIGGAEGGNALIGAFDNDDNILWSWHIWVCPDLLDPSTQEVKDDCIEKWTLNDYDVMDRNLGALSNHPDYTDPDNMNSVASMGLLYQWGRKDPFVGAGYSNDNFSGTGVLKSYVYYPEPWGVLNNGAYSSTGSPTAMNTTAIIKCIQHPTQLVYGGTDDDPTGLSSIPEIGGFLWGTNNGLSTTVKDLGTKTIYDPSPAGYRVPPVDAFVFSDPNVMTWEMDVLFDSILEANEILEDDIPFSYRVYDAVKGTLIDQKYLPGGIENNGTSSIWIELYSDSHYTTLVYQDFLPPRYHIDQEGYYKWYRLSQGPYTGESGTSSWIKNTSDDDMPVWVKAYNDNNLRNPKLYSSEFYHWNENLIFIPYCIDRILYPSNYNNIYPHETIWTFCGPYINLAYFFGFYMNYRELKNPEPGGGIYQVKKGDMILYDNIYFDVKDHKDLTWLPLTGAYDPTQGYTFKDANGKVIPIPRFEQDRNDDPIEGFSSSISVNSFLWTNSSVKKKDRRTGVEKQFPAAMFLHGTEPPKDADGHLLEGALFESNKSSVNRGYGRHIHCLTDADIQADPHYAGGVRCVKDREKTHWDQNTLTDTTTIYAQADATTDITIVSVNASWTLVKPGAPWLRVTPDRGDADAGVGSIITLTMLDPPASVGDETSLEFKIANEQANRKVVVKVIPPTP